MTDCLPPDIVNTAPCGFEGAEKKIEVEFKSEGSKSERGLRDIPQEHWQHILDVIKCQIVSKTSNDHFDSYVLSESSLFVYPFKVILKTCGTTITLLCLEPLLKMAKDLVGLVPDFFWYARKNFQYPDKQIFPHTGFDDECDMMNKFFDGHAYVIGPRTGEHWHLYVCDMKHRDHVGDDQTLEIMMTELDPAAMAHFYRGDDYVSAKHTTIKSGIANLLPGSITDEVMFNPCGYSVNGILDQYYFTIHITPEPHCSYVSFETNAPKDSYTGLINQVLEVFRPNKFTVTLFADAGASCGPSTYTAYEPKVIDRQGYSLKYKSFSEFDGTYDLHLCHFQRRETATR